MCPLSKEIVLPPSSPTTSIPSPSCPFSCCQVVYAEEQDWDGIIKQAAAGGDVAEAAFMEALQKKMELIVLGMQSGSYAQRVQAEFLKEVEARAKSVYRELAAAGKQ